MVVENREMVKEKSVGTLIKYRCKVVDHITWLCYYMQPSLGLAGCIYLETSRHGCHFQKHSVRTTFTLRVVCFTIISIYMYYQYHICYMNNIFVYITFNIFISTNCDISFISCKRGS